MKCKHDFKETPYKFTEEQNFSRKNFGIIEMVHVQCSCGEEDWVIGREFDDKEANEAYKKVAKHRVKYNKEKYVENMKKAREAKKIMSLEYNKLRGLMMKKRLPYKGMTEEEMRKVLSL
jgi:hypothetical protein